MGFSHRYRLRKLKVENLKIGMDDDLIILNNIRNMNAEKFEDLLF